MTRAQLHRTALVLALAGCGNLTCDQQKQQAIKHMNAGVEAANSQSFATAEKELETALSLDPENHRAAYALGQVYVEQRKWDKAETALEMAVKYNPQDAMYQYHLGHARYELGKLDQARLALEESVKQNKRLYKAHFYLGKIHAAQERPKDAATSYTESCRLNPGFGKPFYELGKLYFEWDHHQEAIQVLVQGASNARDAEDLSDINHQLGMAYDALKQYDKAVEAYEKALEARKDNLEARFQLGMAYAAKGDKAKARKYLEEFVKQGGAGNTFLIQAANDRLLKLTGE